MTKNNFTYDDIVDLLWKMAKRDYLDPKKTQQVVACVSEINKMQGNYSAEKRINVNVESKEEKEVKRMVDEELAKRKSDC